MGRMVPIIIPFGIIGADSAIGIAIDQPCNVAVILGRQMDGPAKIMGANSLGDLDQDRLFRLVVNLVDRIQPEAIETVFVQPEKRVLDEEAPDGVELIGDGTAPRGVALRMEEFGRVEPQIIPVRAEMVVDDIQKDHQPARMSGVDQALQPLRPAIGDMRRIEQHTIIAPAAHAGKLRDGTKLDRGDAKIGEMVEARLHTVECALGRESADMKLVKHGLVPGAALPFCLPVESLRIDQHGCAMHIASLRASRRIGDIDAAGRHEIIVASRISCVLCSEPAAVLLIHLETVRTKQQPHLRAGRRPDAELPSARPRRFGAPASAERAHFRGSMLSSTDTARPPTMTGAPGSIASQSGSIAPALVSISQRHFVSLRCSGMVNSISSARGFSMMASECSPAPFSISPMHPFMPLSQSWPSITMPSGRNQMTSGICFLPTGSPWRNFCARSSWRVCRIRISPATKAAKSWSPCSQSSQFISVSWQ